MSAGRAILGSSSRYERAGWDRVGLEGNALLDLGSLAAGAYLVRLVAGDIEIARTLIKR